MNAAMVFPGLLRAVRVSICGTLLMAVMLPAFTSAQTKSQDPALELQTLEDFHAAAQMVARKPVTDTDEGYRASLEKHQKTAQTAGDLKRVLAAKQAIADLDAGRPPVSDDPSVAAIQKAYIVQRQKAVAASEQAVAKIDQAHLVSLKKLVVELTKAGHIEQAMKAQAKVDELAALPDPKAAPAQAATGEQEIEIWKKKAQEEFPALKDPASPLNKQLKALMDQKKTSPSFFKNPQWPYLLAKEANQSTQSNEIIETRHAIYDIKPSHETALLRKGRKMFSDRKYEWGEIPKNVLDWGYTQQNIRQRKEILVKSKGLVFICTKLNIEDERKALLKKCEEAGWIESGFGEIFEPNVTVKWLILKKEFENGLHAIPVWDERVGTIVIRPDLKQMLNEVAK
jgi:hypothetical protein